MHEPYYLPATKLTLRELPDNRLEMMLDGQKVQLGPPRRSLPLSDPDRFIVFTDSHGQELGILNSIEELEPESRQKLQGTLERLYQVLRVTRVLEVEKEPITGQTRWRVEVAAPTEQHEDISPETTANGTSDGQVAERSAGIATTGSDGANGAGAEKLLEKVKWFRRGSHEHPQIEEEERTEEREFLINGQEDVQTARYPTIYIVDVDRNRYEIIDCEALDAESRRAAERFF